MDRESDDRYVVNSEVMNELVHTREVVPSKFESSMWIADEGEEDEKRKSEVPENQNIRFLWAGEMNQLDMMEEMLNELPALINVRDEDGYTALHRACYNNHCSMVKLLLSKGADVHAETIDGWSPLHSACRWNCYECASILLQNGAYVNARSHGNLTPLHLAASNAEARETLELLLLNRYIDASIISKAGDSAFDIATRSGPFGYLFEMVKDSATCLYEKTAPR